MRAVREGITEVLADETGKEPPFPLALEILNAFSEAWSVLSKISEMVNLAKARFYFDLEKFSATFNKISEIVPEAVLETALDPRLSINKTVVFDWKEFERDNLIRMTSSEDGAQATFWIIQRIGDGFRPDKEILDKGNRIIWAGPPGIYSIDMFVVTSEGPRQFFERVTILGEVTPPEPDDTDDTDDGDDDTPTPNPNPTPPEPGKFGYAKLVFDEAMKIDPAPRAALAESIAVNYKSVAAAIRAGGLLTQDQIFDEIIARNADLKDDPSYPKWQSWAQALDNKISSDLDSTLTNRDDIAAVFSEIHDGLMATVK